MSQLTDEEFNNQVENLFENMKQPQVCNFCDFFSGNFGKGLRSENYGQCMNETSPKHLQMVHEKECCIQGPINKKEKEMKQLPKKDRKLLKKG